MKIHTVLILAGGDGTRFFPLEEKVQYQFNGKTVLRHIVERVASYAEHIVVVVNAQNKKSIEEDLKSYSVILVVQTHDGGGMADAVLAASQHLTADTLILSGNDVFDFSVLPDVIKKTIDQKSFVGLVAKFSHNYFPGGYIQFEGESAKAIIEKPGEAKRPSDYVRLVADYFPDTQFFIEKMKEIPPSDSQYEAGLNALLLSKSAYCLKYQGDWATIKYSWHVLSMQDYFLEHHLKRAIDPTAAVAKSAIIEGNVFVGKNVKIGAYSKISGPCYIADNGVIGDHSLVRGSSIGEGALVGSGCEVARSYIGAAVMLHRNYVGDSVLARAVTMGAGAVTANYRFDGASIQTPIGGKMTDTQRSKCGVIAGIGVKIGVNSSTYPGVKLSPGTLILPGSVVQKDR